MWKMKRAQKIWAESGREGMSETWGHFRRSKQEEDLQSVWPRSKNWFQWRKYKIFRIGYSYNINWLKVHLILRVWLYGSYCAIYLNSMKKLNLDSVTSRLSPYSDNWCSYRSFIKAKMLSMLIIWNLPLIHITMQEMERRSSLMHEKSQNNWTPPAPKKNKMQKMNEKRKKR